MAVEEAIQENIGKYSLSEEAEIALDSLGWQMQEAGLSQPRIVTNLSHAAEIASRYNNPEKILKILDKNYDGSIKPKVQTEGLRTLNEDERTLVEKGYHLTTGGFETRVDEYILGIQSRTPPLFGGRKGSAQEPSPWQENAIRCLEG